MASTASRRRRSASTRCPSPPSRTRRTTRSTIGWPIAGRGSSRSISAASPGGYGWIFPKGDHLEHRRRRLEVRRTDAAPPAGATLRLLRARPREAVRSPRIPVATTPRRRTRSSRPGDARRRRRVARRPSFRRGHLGGIRQRRTRRRGGSAVPRRQGRRPAGLQPRARHGHARRDSRIAHGYRPCSNACQRRRSSCSSTTTRSGAT